MKKLILKMMMISFAALAFASCGGGNDDDPEPITPPNPTIEVTDISLSQTSATIAVGASQTLVVTVLPANATDKSFSVASSNPAVATVDANVKITGVTTGTATITVTAGTKTATCTVTVVNATFNKVFEYEPAPGQFINEGTDFANVTTKAAAASYAQAQLQKGTYVSLGGFGGYIVVGFDHSIENKGAHDGYDFSVTGNAFDGSSEPGVVWVMRDDNGNGKPDDTWYELKGSEYGKTETVQNYEVTYYKPSNTRENVRWTDNLGGTGYVEVNTYHTQDSYYPNWITDATYTLKGTRLEKKEYFNSLGYYCTGGYEWGYADSFGSDRIDATKSTKNFFKIANAIKADGTAANLTKIDFVKVQCAVNFMGQRGVGEISTEVFAFEDENI